MKMGYVRAVFGVVSTSALDAYQTISKQALKKQLVCEFVDYGATSLRDCDIAIFNGVKTYVDCAAFLHSKMIAVVCGGPLQIDGLQGIIPLDYSKSLSYQFNLIPLDASKVISARRKWKEYTPVSVKRLKMNHLAMVLDNTATGGILLTEWNKLLSVLNMTARSKLRVAFTTIVAQKADPSLLQSVASTFVLNADTKRRLKELMDKITTPEAGQLWLCLRDTLDKTKAINVKSLSRKYGIEEFELNFFRKMIADELKNASKNYYDAVNLKIPEQPAKKGKKKA